MFSHITLRFVKFMSLKCWASLMTASGVASKLGKANGLAMASAGDTRKCFIVTHL
ncbi:MAG: hypothetical protein ACKESB_00675 [Candidatus Hodgkinia cicadicola]